ncbi:MAG: transposase [Candidatus Aerophobetes bacterium]|nr:transposase [Candidatus Aerophobetes bacterium]
MNKKKRRYIRREKEERFKKKIKGIEKEKILGISIDISKDYHKGLIFDFEGRILDGPFEFDVFKDGYEDLKQRVGKAIKEREAKKVFFGLEPTGPYHENLARHLKEDFKEVEFINPSATYANRAQDMLVGLKTDDIDLGAVGDLLIRGKGYEYNLEEAGVYLNLKEETFWREKKLKMQTRLKNQIKARLNKIYPGIMSKYNDNEPLFSDLWKSRVARGLIRSKLTPAQIQTMKVEELKKEFKKVSYSLTSRWAEKIIGYIKRMLPPKDEILEIEMDLLNRDLNLLEALEGEMSLVEERMVEEVKKTDISFLLGKIKGLSDVMIASFAGAVGRIGNYKLGKQIFSKSGLSSKVSQSGKRNIKGLSIRRVGSKIFRCILFKMGDAVKKHNPYFALYYSYLTEERGKLWKKAHIAVSNKLVRVMFAMLRDRADFNPPTAKIDYLEMLFSQRRRRRRQERKKEKESRSPSPLFGPKGIRASEGIPSPVNKYNQKGEGVNSL